MTRRRWIADTWTDTSATLRGEQAQHLARVLRARPGMVFDVACSGRVWRSSVREVSEDAVHFDLLEEVEVSAALPLTLLLSVFKFDRMEWAVEKATELGVRRIVPVLAQRTEKHLAQAAGKRAERWRRIALEAAKQSRAAAVPQIADPVLLPAALQAATTPASASGTGITGGAHVRLLLSEQEQDTQLASALEGRSTISTPASVSLAIGPEGGWSPGELGLFAQTGWQPVTLGPRILRAETAAIAALAICGSFLGG